MSERKTSRLWIDLVAWEKPTIRELDDETGDDLFFRNRAPAAVGVVLALGLSALSYAIVWGFWTVLS